VYAGKIGQVPARLWPKPKIRRARKNSLIAVLVLALVSKAGKNKNKTKNIGVVFLQKKTRTRGGRYCKTRDITELIVARSIDR
jgi:hypothetical protein